MFNLDKLIRTNIRNLVPYSSARDEFKGKEGIFLDANENALGSVIGENLNRYPDPMQMAVKEKLAEIKGITPENIFLGNGSDEAIDLLIRAFCNPAQDNIIIFPPTYGMYEVSANINDIKTIKVNLTNDFQLDIEKTMAAIAPTTKLLFVCSPNNPTANAIHPNNIIYLAEHFDGIVVVDEAYIDFSNQKSFINELEKYPNLVILQTFSKAWGMANLRLGMAFSNPAIIKVLNKIKPPYNVNGQTQELALRALDKMEEMHKSVKELLQEREKLISKLPEFDFVFHVYPTDANFILVKVKDPKALYQYLIAMKIIVRDRSSVALCEGCLRITVGTHSENQKLINAFKAYK